MKYSSRFFLYAPLALFLSLAAGVSIHWWFAANALSKRLDAMNAHEAMPGVVLRFDSKEIGGFPFRLDAVFTNFEILVSTGHGMARWQAENFALHQLTYGREQLIFEAAGKQRLIWTDNNGAPHSLAFETGATHASAIEDDKGLSRFDLDLVDLGSTALTGARLQFHIRRNPAHAALDVALGAEDLHLSSHSAFGNRIATLNLIGTLAPAAAFEKLRAGDTDWQSAAEAWRGADGTFHADRLDIVWDKISAHGRGTLGLDSAHRPSGFLDFKIAGIMYLLLRSDVPPGPNKGIASALTDRAAKAGSDEAGLLGAVIGFKDGIVTVGDEPTSTINPLY